MCAAVGDNNAEGEKMSMKKALPNYDEPVFVRAFMPVGYASEAGCGAQPVTSRV
jgi:hypothetical protein